MQIISCDVCKKKIDNSITGRTFFYFSQFSICEPCRDNLETSLKATVRNKDPFSYEWYNKLVGDTLTKSVQKGK